MSKNCYTVFPVKIWFVCCEENDQSSGMECVSCVEDIKLATQSCNT
jgi:polyferredoxin